MFIQKPRRTSNNGIITTPYSYSNTNQTDNTPVTAVTAGSDLNHLSPTLTQPPIAPDTITPQLTPDTDRINLMLPVSGFVGTVYVVLTKPTPSAAVVVVEVDNDEMYYNENQDIVTIGAIKASGATGLGEGYEYSPARFEHNLQRAKEETVSYIRQNIAPYDASVIGDGAYKIGAMIANRLSSEIKKVSYKLTATGEPVGALLISASASNVNFVTLNYGDSSRSGFVSIPMMFTVTPPAEPVTIDLGETVNIQNETYKVQGNTARTVTLPVRMYFEYLMQPLILDETTHSAACFVVQLDITVKYIPAVYCHPLVESFDVDAGTAKIVKEHYFGSGTTKLRVRRGYINIGGKLKYVYTVKATKETEVFVNYDGSNYGLIVATDVVTKIVINTSLKPTASFTNNVNGFTLNATQQTALQQCLPQPDDTLAGGFKAMNGATEISFKTYGFKSIFYQTPTKYNNTTLKACAVYGL